MKDSKILNDLLYLGIGVAGGALAEVAAKKYLDSKPGMNFAALKSFSKPSNYIPAAVAAGGLGYVGYRGTKKATGMNDIEHVVAGAGLYSAVKTIMTLVTPAAPATGMSNGSVRRVSNQFVQSRVPMSGQNYPNAPNLSGRPI